MSGNLLTPSLSSWHQPQHEHTAPQRFTESIWGGEMKAAEYKVPSTEEAAVRFMLRQINSSAMCWGAKQLRCTPTLPAKLPATDSECLTALRDPRCLHTNGGLHPNTSNVVTKPASNLARVDCHQAQALPLESSKMSVFVIMQILLWTRDLHRRLQRDYRVYIQFPRLPHGPLGDLGASNLIFIRGLITLLRWQQFELAELLKDDVCNPNLEIPGNFKFYHVEKLEANKTKPLEK